MLSLQTHGPVQVVAAALQHDDGTPFFWLGDTHWFAMTSRCSIEDLKKIVELRAKQGFTGIQTVVGIPPEVSPWSKNAANSGGHPFTKEHQINHEYFSEVTQKLDIIVSAGLVPLIVGGWGYHIDTFGVELYKKWWQELISRYSNLPVIWCLAGEVDLFPGLEYGEKLPSFVGTVRKHLPTIIRKVIAKIYTVSQSKKLEKRLQAWNQVGEFIARHDVNNRPITVHPQSMLAARELFPQANWLSVNAIQSGHSHDRLAFMQEKTAQEVRYRLPFINLEPWYEGIFDDFGPEYQEQALEIIIQNKAVGMTYGAQGLWNMNSKQSPFLTHWGSSTWEKALKYQGAQQIGKKLLQFKRNLH